MAERTASSSFLWLAINNTKLKNLNHTHLAQAVKVFVEDGRLVSDFFCSKLGVVDIFSPA